MVTVEVDSVHVESRLSAGEIECPCCDGGSLSGWGYARPRSIIGTGERVQPRRGRCRGCRVTHVLLPVTLLLRRAYLAELILAALAAKANGRGYRPIAARMGVPESTVRGWLRVVERRAGAVRNWFLAVAVAAGVDVSVPKAAGSGCGDVVAAVAAARRALGSRFGDRRVVGAVTVAGVAVACSGGRLLSPGWPPAPVSQECNTN